MGREWKPGDLLATDLRRIVARLAVEDRGYVTPCWITDYSIDRGGYRSLRSGGRMQKLHRLTYEALIGPVPAGLHVDHLCRVRECCNPAHLEAVTPRENTLRGLTITAINAAKTHCDSGHEFTPENTAYRANGTRKCITCRRAHRMAHYYRNRVSA
jgi:hypothetical protein